MRKNKGYTLVELLIAITIMLILTATSFVTISIIKSANCKSAMNKFDDEISSCLIRTKATSKVDKPTCMYIKKITKPGTNTVLYAVYSATIDGGSISGEELQVELPKELGEIEYEPSVDEQKATFVDDEDGVGKIHAFIQFIKSDGSVQYGAGSYKLKDKSGDVYATICLDKASGNHYIK